MDARGLHVSGTSLCSYYWGASALPVVISSSVMIGAAWGKGAPVCVVFVFTHRWRGALVGPSLLVVWLPDILLRI